VFEGDRFIQNARLESARAEAGQHRVTIPKARAPVGGATHPQVDAVAVRHFYGQSLHKLKMRFIDIDQHDFRTLKILSLVDQRRHRPWCACASAADVSQVYACHAGCSFSNKTSVPFSNMTDPSKSALSHCQGNCAMQSRVISQMAQSHLRGRDKFQVVFHDPSSGLDKSFSAAHCHTAADADDVRCVEGGHIAQSLPQVISDFLPFILLQSLRRLAVDPADPVPGNQCLQAVGYPAFTLYSGWVRAPKMD
jgi:hypothetical protein